MAANPVRAGLDLHSEATVLGPVTIDDPAITSLSTDIANTTVTLPDWRSAALPDESDVGQATVFDTVLVANALNFQFDHYHTGETFTTTYAGEAWTGAYALFACFTRALDDGIPVTSSEYLTSVGRDDVASLLRGDPSISRLPDRHRILRHIGDRLQKFDGTGFSDAIPGTGPYPAVGDGFVEWLARSFPVAYNDRRTLDGTDLPFLKKAQLAAAILAGRFGDEGDFGVTGLAGLTVFPDYVLPAVLREAGVLSYTDRLGHRVDSGNIIPVGSRAEIGLRAGTVLAGDRLLAAVNDQRTNPLTAAHLDYYLWQSGRVDDLPVHRTPTTSY